MVAVEIQALWFRTDKFSKSQAEDWCEEHEFKHDVYRTKEDDDGVITHHIFPQFDPQDESIDPDSWGVIADDFPEGISASVCQRKDNSMNMKYKSASVDKATGEVCLTDATIDSWGDIVMPEGGDLTQFKNNPIMLFAHNHKEIIGTWTKIRKTAKGIFATPKFAEWGTSAYSDTARKLWDQGILKAASIGFTPVEWTQIKETGGYKFIKWILNETSLVAVGANPNALAVAKSIGADPRIVREILARTVEKGHYRAPVEGHGTGNKGTASGPVSNKHQSQSQSKGSKSVKTIAERIAAKEQRLVAIKDDLTVLKGLLEDEGYELTDDEQDRIDTLTDEETAVTKSIESLRKLEAGLAAKAEPVQSFAQRGVAPGAPAKKAKGGELIAKHITAALFANKYQQPIQSVVEQLYGKDDRVKATIGLTSTVMKTAVPAADTLTSGWAAELVSEDTDAFMTDLQPISVYAALRARGRGLNFAGMGSLKIPRRGSKTGANNMAGAWVGEGGVIPVKKGQVASSTLHPYKLAVISAWTNELDARSVPAIEGLVREMILEDTAATLDGYLLDSVGAVANIRPAGLLNGVTPVASAGGTAANIITDLKALFAALQAARIGGNPVLIMNPIRLLGLSTITTAAGGFLFRDEIAAGRLLGVPVITSENVPAASVVIVDAASFVAANDVPEFKISDEATLTMANADGTAPTQAESAATAGTIGTPEQVPPKHGIHVNQDPTDAFAAGAQALSLFQTYQTAIRMVLPTGWGMTRSNVVAALSGVAW